MTPVWDGHTVTTDLETADDAEIGFRSQLAGDIFNADTEWRAQSFHFHVDSEHTIDGQRFDGEMQTVHTAKTEILNDFSHAVTGILFSVENYTADLTLAEVRIIDTFFDTMKFGDDPDDPTVDFIAIANMMELVDMNNRWVYQGSLTTPPCSTNVY